MPPTHTPEPEYLIDDLETLKVLSDPRRMAILEELGRAEDGLTVKQVGEALGQDPAGLYYHVRLLERHGLIVVVDTRLVSGIVEKQYGLRARTFQVSHALLTTSGSGEGGQSGLLTTFLDSTRAEMEASLRAGLLRLEASEPERTAFCQKAFGMRLAPERARELRHRLMDLMAEYDEPTGYDRGLDAQTYALLVALYPLAPPDMAASDSAETIAEDPEEDKGEAG
jgi:DNA-binding transcriptional ArsR family regulator